MATIGLMMGRGACTALAAVILAATLALGGCGGSSAFFAAARPHPAVGGAVRASGADWPMFDVDAQRTGVGPVSTGIGTGQLHRLGLRIASLDGTVDSAPVELHAVRVRGRRRDAIFVTSTYGRTIAIDPGTSRRLWEYTPAGIASLQGSAQVTTATPVVDPDRRYVYAASPNGFLHKLSVASGREVRAVGWPVRVTFDPGHEKIAGALSLSGPSVIVVTGGYIGDAPTYQGHLVMIDRRTGRITSVFNTLCANRRGLINPPRACPHSDSAIWGRAGVVVEPGTHRLLIATGNGSFDGALNWGNSVLELSARARLLHHWTPANERLLSAHDTDVGSAAPAFVAVGGRRLAIQGDKEGKLYLLDLDRLSGTTGAAGPRLGGELQAVASPGQGEVLTAPAVWGTDGRRYVFVADDSGTAAYIVRGGAHPRLAVAWQNATAGTSPVVAGGLVFVYDEIQGALNVYQPRSGARLASLPCAPGHWNSPIVVGGRIVLPVGSYHNHALGGRLYIWHVRGR